MPFDLREEANINKDDYKCLRLSDQGTFCIDPLSIARTANAVFCNGTDSEPE